MTSTILPKACKFKQHIDSVDVSSSGHRVIISLSSLEGNTWDGSLKLLNGEGVEICSKHSTAGISTVRFSGSRLLLAARDDGNVMMYSSDKLDEMQVFEAHDDIVSCVAVDPHNETRFATCGWDGAIHLWDWRLHSAKKMPVTSYINCHNGHVNEVKFSPFDPHSFISVGRDGLLRVWDKRAALSSGCSGIVNVGQTISCISYESSDEKILLVGTDAGDISLLDLRGGGPCPVISVNRTHQARVRRIVASPSLESKQFVSASDDKTYVICTRNNASVTQQKRYASDYLRCSLNWTFFFRLL